jgi:hypothetical protein
MRYSFDRDSERIHFATVLQHENPSLSQSNANRHDGGTLIAAGKNVA